MIRPRAILLCGLVLASLGCPSQAVPPWQQVFRKLPSALTSVWGTSAKDVWAVGADSGDGKGPMILHFDGSGWQRLESGQTGNLWWVFGFKDGPVYLGGEGGVILEYSGQTFTRMPTPGNDGVFGIWGASPADVWAVGGAIGGAQGAFAWRLQGDQWVSVADFPAEVNASQVMWKVAGKSASEVWMVGTNGSLLHWDGTALSKSNAGTGEALFTVAANQERFVAVGGFATGTILENTGSGWKNVGPPSMAAMVGVALSQTKGVAVGYLGAVYDYHPPANSWTSDETAIQFNGTLHAAWIDPDEGIWTVGGQLTAPPLNNGVVIYRGKLALPADAGF